LLRRRLAIVEKLVPQDPVALADTLDDLADALVELRRHSEAEPLRRRVVDILEAILPAHHRQLVIAANKHAVLLGDGLGWFDQAEPLLPRALAIFEKTLAPDDPTGSARG
jgi:hypothetical protein